MTIRVDRRIRVVPAAGLDPPCPDVTISSNADSVEEESSLVPKSPVPFSLGESPLTDPRSVGSSALFHVIVILLASLTALNVALPMAASRPKALYARDRSCRQPRGRS